MINKITIMGNLTRDCELKQVADTHVCKFGLATNRKFKDKTGQLKEEVCFIDVNVWGRQAENCAKYLSKGKPVLIDGTLKQETWERDGQKNSKHVIVANEVIFLGSNTNNQMINPNKEISENEPSESEELSNRAAQKFYTNKGEVKSKPLISKPFVPYNFINDKKNNTPQDNLPF